MSGVLIAVLTLVEVTVTGPRVAVRWDAHTSPAERAALEQRYGLRRGEPDQAAGSTGAWRYELTDPSHENIRALIGDPAVVDTGYIDRDSLEADKSNVRISMRSMWYPLHDLFDRPSQVFRLYQSGLLLLAGGFLLLGARAAGERRRRHAAITTLALVGVMAVAFPISPSFVRMGESRDHLDRAHFETHFGGRVRFEKHLAQTMLFQVYRSLPHTEAAPERALLTMSRFAAAWFVLSALIIGVIERWSPVVLRYFALALLAPATLLYFGWEELGYLSLNVAAFPLLVRGLRDGGARLEAASVVSGLGAALHGSGLVSLAGVVMAALGTRARLHDWSSRVLRVIAWGTAAYLGWVAIYLIVLKLPIVPDAGALGVNPWRPWFADEVRQGRVASALLSATSARDLLMTAWVVGAPLLFAALSLRRQYPHEVRTALLYLPPSILFLVFRWPFAGLHGGMDLVVAGFPALYALTWVCAQDEKRTLVAAALLASAHLAFWRIVLDQQFQPVQIA